MEAIRDLKPRLKIGPHNPPPTAKDSILKFLHLDSRTLKGPCSSPKWQNLSGSFLGHSSPLHLKFNRNLFITDTLDSASLFQGWKIGSKNLGF